MSKQLDAMPCIGCKFFCVRPAVRSRCLNNGNMCNDFSCYREQSLTRAELVALLSRGVNHVREANFVTDSGMVHADNLRSWLIETSEALDRE